MQCTISTIIDAIGGRPKYIRKTDAYSATELPRVPIKRGSRAQVLDTLPHARKDELC
jgi:hypothetical protein